MYTIYNKFLSGQSKNTFLQVYPISHFLSKSYPPWVQLLTLVFLYSTRQQSEILKQ